MRNVQRREETRSSILDAAARSFAEHGYDATGVAQICQQAGISKGAFYYHFETKQAVFLALVTDWLEELDASLDILADVEGAAPERLLTMSRRFREIMASQSHRLPLIMEFWTQASRDDTVRQAMLTPYRSFQALFADLIEDGIAEGSFRPIDPAQGGQAILSLASGLFLQALLSVPGPDWGEVAERSVRMLLDGMRSVP